MKFKKNIKNGAEARVSCTVWPTDQASIPSGLIRGETAHSTQRAARSAQCTARSTQHIAPSTQRLALSASECHRDKRIAFPLVVNKWLGLVRFG